MDTKRRLLELDALRAIASFAVLLYHYTTRYEELFGHFKKNYFSFSYGYLGVHIFFMISGFVIFMTLNRTENLDTYLKKRIFRLYPAYIIAVVLIYVMVKMIGLEGRIVSLWEAVINLTMLQGLIPRVSHVDGAFWTLTVQLTFYIFMGVAFYKGFVKNIFSFSMVWLSVSSVLMIINNLINSKVMNFITFLSISKYSHLFIAGILFYHIRENKKYSYYVGILACLLYEYVFIEDFASNTAISLFFLIFNLLINDKLRFLSIKPLVFLGSISYSVYLLHQNIGYIIISNLEKTGLVNEIFLVIPISIIIILSTIITLYIERPFNGWLKNRYEVLPNINKIVK